MTSLSVSMNQKALPVAPKPAPVVFVVDDDISVRESLEALIRFAGWQTVTFESAHQFLAHPREAAPSCLVLDVSLPDLSGLDLQKRMALEHADLPIIFITGYGDVPMTVQAMKAGAVEFLTKPLSDEALLGAIQSALERSEAALDQEAKMGELRSRYVSLSRRAGGQHAQLCKCHRDDRADRRGHLCALAGRAHRIKPAACPLEAGRGATGCHRAVVQRRAWRPCAPGPAGIRLPSCA